MTAAAVAAAALAPCAALRTARDRHLARCQFLRRAAEAGLGIGLCELLRLERSCDAMLPAYAMPGRRLYRLRIHRAAGRVTVLYDTRLACLVTVIERRMQESPVVSGRRYALAPDRRADGKTKREPGPDHDRLPPGAAGF